MTDHEYEILLFIRKNQPVPFGKIVNSFSPEQRINETRAIIKSYMDKYLTKTSRADPDTRCRIRLTEAGQNAILQEESIRQENVRREQAEEQKELERIVRDKSNREADRHAEHRFQVRLSFWNTVFGMILGALISNLDRIIEWVISLFS